MPSLRGYLSVWSLIFFKFLFCLFFSFCFLFGILFFRPPPQPFLPPLLLRQYELTNKHNLIYTLILSFEATNSIVMNTSQATLFWRLYLYPLQPLFNHSSQSTTYIFIKTKSPQEIDLVIINRQQFQVYQQQLLLTHHCSTKAPST